MQCLVCKGSGVVNRWVDGIKKGVSVEEEVECARCRGTGQVEESPTFLTTRPTNIEEVYKGQAVYILYTNWEGKTAWRRILPWKMDFRPTEKHLDPQWVLEAYDLDKRLHRSFALKDIKSWLVEMPKAYQTGEVIVG